MTSHAGTYFHLHLISDSTGETLITVARAASAQYSKVQPVEHVYPLVRTQKQLDRVLAEIAEEPGIVLYTLLEDDLVERLEKTFDSLERLETHWGHFYNWYDTRTLQPMPPVYISTVAGGNFLG